MVAHYGTCPEVEDRDEELESEKKEKEIQDEKQREIDAEKRKVGRKNGMVGCVFNF